MLWGYVATISSTHYAGGEPVNFVDPSGNRYIESADNAWEKPAPQTPEAAEKRKNKRLVSQAIRSGAEGITDGIITKGIISGLKDERLLPLNYPSYTLRQYKSIKSVTVLKGLSKIAGPVAFGSYLYDAYQDYNRYHQGDFWMALGLTTVGAAAGIVTGIAIGALVAPAAGVAAGIAIGFYANVKVNQLKREIIGY